MVSLTGLLAYAALYASVVTGCCLSSPTLRRRAAALRTARVHEPLALVGFALGAVHGAIALPRGGRALAWLLVSPWAGPGAPIEAGVLGLYATGVVLLSFYLRRRLGSRLWRWLHALSYPTLAAVAWHGLAAGANAWLPAVRWFYALTLGSAAVLAALRAAEGLRSARGRAA